MNILTERTNDNPLGKLSLEELSTLLKDEVISNRLDELTKALETIPKEIPKVTREELLFLISDKSNTASFRGLNISNTSSIEKDNSILIGTLYYNSKTDKVRIKLKKGWTNLN